MINLRMKEVEKLRRELDALVNRYGLSHSKVFAKSQEIDTLVKDIHLLQLKDIREEEEILKLY